MRSHYGSEPIDKLGEREKLMLSFYLQGLTYQQIADNCGLSTERVRQILAKTFAVLSKHYQSYWRPIIRRYAFEDFKRHYDT